MKQLLQRRGEIDQKLSAPQSNGGRSVSELMKERAEVECDVGAAEHRWLVTSDAAERVDRPDGAA